MSSKCLIAEHHLFGEVPFSRRKAGAGSVSLSSFTDCGARWVAVATILGLGASYGVEGAANEPSSGVSQGKMIRETVTNSVGMKLARIEPGGFSMGSDRAGADRDERPVHRVTISRPFYIGTTEVTAEQFRQFRPGYVGSRGPVSGIGWYEASAFCEWLSEKEGKSYRLPTEAEWEYACRAGTETRFFTGKTLPESELVNPWGLENMHAGVAEWCRDWYGPYRAVSQMDPVGPRSGIGRVVRGGGLDDSDPTYARSANRASLAPKVGIRILSSRATGGSVELEESLKAGLAGTWFTSSSLRRIGGFEALPDLNQDFSDSGKGSGWSARWRGYIEAPATEVVSFHAEPDSGILLKIGGREIIQQWFGGKKASGEISMVKGKHYPVRLFYYTEGGKPSLKIDWSFGGHARSRVAAEAIGHTARDRQRAKAIGSQQGFGMHSVGFRVVQGPESETEPSPFQKPMVQQGVKSTRHLATQGPSRDDSYFRKRYLLPVPPDNASAEAIRAAGFPPSVQGHQLRPAITACPNGDLLVVLSSTDYQGDTGGTLIATRLRFGADQWDRPAPFMNFADASDQSPLLGNKKGSLRIFWGNPELTGAYPFQWSSSDDNGATWSKVQVPTFDGWIRDHLPRPINTVFTSEQGTTYLSSQAPENQSLLWTSADDGKGWVDPGGRTGAKDTVFVRLRNGNLLGMGGAGAAVNGFMPKFVSRDGGQTWEIKETPFPALGSQQRPSLLRLQSGRLFFASDFQKRGGAQPSGIDQKGVLVALSEDEGESWHIKALPGAQPHERDKPWGATLGFSAACQAPNGVIHLVTTMTHPCLHFAINEAWILSDDVESDGRPFPPRPNKIENVKQRIQRYPGGEVQARWSAGVSPDGRFLLHGTETWFYKNGQKRWEVSYNKGRRVRKETCWTRDGRKKWRWKHRPGSVSTRTEWWPNGQKKAESSWRRFKAQGRATRWDRTGKEMAQWQFINSKHVDEKHD